MLQHVLGLIYSSIDSYENILHKTFLSFYFPFIQLIILQFYNYFERGDKDKASHEIE